MDDNVSVIISVMRHILNYAGTARILLFIMYGDSHVPEFDFGKGYDGNVYLNVYMAGKDCCRVKRVIPCEIILSAEDPVNVVYKVLEDMHKLLASYEEQEYEKSKQAEELKKQQAEIEKAKTLLESSGYTVVKGGN